MRVTPRAKRLVADALSTLTGLRSGPVASTVLLRADSAFYGHEVVSTARRRGAEVSITVRMDAKVKAAITQIPADAWETIQYTDAIYDETAGRWISRAEVAEIPFTAFTSRKNRPRAGQAGGRPDP